MKRRRVRPESKGLKYEPVTITPEQAVARLCDELPELADIAPWAEPELYTLYIGTVKRLLATLIDAGRIERVKAVMTLVETGE